MRTAYGRHTLCCDYIRARDIARTHVRAGQPIPLHLVNLILTLSREIHKALRERG